LRQPDRPLSAEALRRLVERRAEGRCEYCRAPQRVCGYRFHIEHILPVAHGGEDGPDNRALACASCNLAKSDRQTGIDPVSGTEVPRFVHVCSIGQSILAGRKIRKTWKVSPPSGGLPWSRLT
jgi:hypothetical protein